VSGVSDDDSRLEFADTVEIATDKDALWQFISDPENLAECVPGAEEIERVTRRKYTCEITRGVSHLTVSLSGEFEMVEMNEPDWIVAEGTAFDSTTGSDFDVLAAMEMTELDDGNVALSYSADLGFTGGVATLGSRLLKGVIRSDIETYFDNIRDAVENGEV
jgi:hypothetical protein